MCPVVYMMQCCNTCLTRLPVSSLRSRPLPHPRHIRRGLRLPNPKKLRPRPRLADPPVPEERVRLRLQPERRRRREPCRKSERGRHVPRQLAQPGGGGLAAGRADLHAVEAVRPREVDPAGGRDVQALGDAVFEVDEKKEAN